MRLLKDKPRSKWMVAIVVIATVLLLPVWIPYFLIWQTVDRRRLIAAAESFKCPTCGEVLGRQAVTLADQMCQRRMEEMRKSHPGIRFRIGRQYRAVCVRCGVRYRYIEYARTFAPIPSV